MNTKWQWDENENNEALCAPFTRRTRQSLLQLGRLLRKKSRNENGKESNSRKIIIFLLNFLSLFPFSPSPPLETLPETRKSVVISFIYEIIFYRFSFASLDSWFILLRHHLFSFIFFIVPEALSVSISPSLVYSQPLRWPVAKVFIFSQRTPNGEKVFGFLFNF